jgi:hypothetical protein
MIHQKAPPPPLRNSLIYCVKEDASRRDLPQQWVREAAREAGFPDV